MLSYRSDDSGMDIFKISFNEEVDSGEKELQVLHGAGQRLLGKLALVEEHVTLYGGNYNSPKMVAFVSILCELAYRQVGLQMKISTQALSLPI
jgi:hypothetical protein